MKKISVIFFVSLCLLISCSSKKSPPALFDYPIKIKYDSIFIHNKLSQIRVFQNNKINEIRFFEKNNSLRKIIKYMDINNKPTPNQFILFNENGDTLKSQSLYYDLYCIKDTIKINEKYQFKVILTGHFFDSAALFLCNYNKEFVLDTTDTKCKIFLMNKAPLYTTVADVNVVEGWNYIRGRIDNYQNYNNQSGKKMNWFVSIYFLDSFYVELK